MIGSGSPGVVLVMPPTITTMPPTPFWPPLPAICYTELAERFAEPVLQGPEVDLRFTNANLSVAASPFRRPRAPLAAACVHLLPAVTSLRNAVRAFGNAAAD